MHKLILASEKSFIMWFNKNNNDDIKNFIIEKHIKYKLLVSSHIYEFKTEDDLVEFKLKFL